MVPPVEQGLLERPYVVGSRSRAHHQHERLTQQERVALFDLWAVLTVMWMARFVSGVVHPVELVFGIVVFMLISSPKARPDRLTPSAFDDAAPLLNRIGMAFALCCAGSLVLGFGQEHELLALAVATAPPVIGGRFVSYAVERKISKALPKKRTLVIGSGETAERVAETLWVHDEYGLELVGALSDAKPEKGSRLSSLRLGNSSAMARFIDEFEAEVVIVASDTAEHSDTVRVLRSAMARGAQVWIVPRMHELGSAPLGDHLWGLPIVRVLPPAQSRPGWSWKRVLDIAGALAALALLAPVLGIVSLLIYLDSGRPIFFKQLRIGRDSKPFEMLKFRTMSPIDPETIRKEWAGDDERITKIGHYLRDYAIDELPQFWHVLKGDMSLVGPRPERVHWVEVLSEQLPNYSDRHRLPAGLTGWSQIHGLRGDTSIEERVMFDNYYVDNWSLSQDLKILARTLTAYRNAPGGTK